MPTTRLLSNLLSRGSLVVAAALTAGCLGTPAMPDTDGDTGTDTDTTGDMDDAEVDTATTGTTADTTGSDTTGTTGADETDTSSSDTESTTDPAPDDDAPPFVYDLADCPTGDAIELLVPGRAELVANHEVNLVWRSSDAVARVQAWLSPNFGLNFPYKIVDVEATGEGLQVEPWNSTLTKIELAELKGSASPKGYQIALAAFDADGALIGCSEGNEDFEIRGWPLDAGERLGDIEFADPVLGAKFAPPYKSPDLPATSISQVYLSQYQSGIDLSGLAHLPMLRFINAYAKGVTSVADLSWLTELEILRLRVSPTSSAELPLLSSLNKLAVLELEYSLIEMSDLPESPELLILGLRHINLRDDDLASLARYPNLIGLHMENNLLKEASALPTYEKIETLSLAGNALTTLDKLPSLPSLTALYVNANNLVEAAGVAKFGALEELRLNENALTDLSSLPPLAKLERLNAERNALTSLEGTPMLPELVSLTLTDNQLTSADGLPELPNLESMGLSKNEFSSIDSLPELPALTYLNLSENSITDVSPLAGYPTLERLDLSKNHIESGVLALAELKNLTDLSLADNPTIPCILQNTVKAELLANNPETTVTLSKTCIDK